MDKPTFAAKLRAARERALLTQKQVAAQLKIDISSYSRWERPGHPNMPNVHHKNDLAVLFPAAFKTWKAKPLPALAEAS